MTRLLVPDASVLVTAFLDDGPAGRACSTALHGARLAAPYLLQFECMNVFRRHESAGLITASDGRDAVNSLLALPVTLWAADHLAERMLELRGHVTSYDAAYVAVAELNDVPLITLDRRLAAAPGIRCDVVVPR